MKTPWASIAKIEVDGVHSGTGFLIAPEHVLTALHVVADSTGKPFRNIRLYFNTNAEFEDGSKVFETGATVAPNLWSADHDFALLRCEAVPSYSQPLELSGYCDLFNECVSPGFAKEDPSGFSAIGDVSSLNDPVGSHTALGIHFRFGAGVLMRGHSGAPVFVNSRVVGLLRTAFLDTSAKTMPGAIVHATPIQRVLEFCSEIAPDLLAFHSVIPWPTPLAMYNRVLADRKEEFEVFERMVTGRSKQRILLLQGESGSGKTVLAGELVGYARTLDMQVASADCKGTLPLDTLVSSLLLDLPQGLLPNTETASGALRFHKMIEDLASLKRPLLIALDTWQDATEEVRKWVEQRVLLNISSMPAVSMMLGGQGVPERKGAAWSDFAALRHLEPIKSVEDWFDYTARNWPSANMTREQIETLITAIGSEEMPNVIDPLLKRLAEKSAGRSRPMTVERLFKRLREAGSDPNQILLVTVEAALSSHEARLREAFEAAAIPHWFDARILAELMGTDTAEAAELTARLANLPMVEPFSEHQGWNIHQSTRLALRLRMHRDEPAKFREMSARAAACWSWPEGDVVSRVEAIYHGLCWEPEKGAEDLERTYWKWQRQGRREATQALGTMLGELKGFPLTEAALGRTLLIFGWIHLGRIALPKSEQLATEALTILKKTGPESSRADAHCLLGRIMQQQGKLTAALAEYQVFNQIMGRLTGLDVTNTDWQRDLSVSHNYVGSIYREQGRLNEALAEYQAFKHIMERLTALDPANTDWQRDLSVSHNYAGSIYQAQGRPDEALAEYQASKQIMERLTALDPANTGWQRELSASHNLVGSIDQAQGRLNEALAEYQAFKQIMERLSALDPANTDWQRDLSVSHNNVGSIYQAQGRLNDALAEHQAAKQIMERLTALDPANTDWQRDLSVSHNCVGSIYQAQGRLNEALAEYQADSAIAERLVLHDPINVTWQSDADATRRLIESLRAELNRKT